MKKIVYVVAFGCLFCEIFHASDAEAKRKKLSQENVSQLRELENDPNVQKYMMLKGIKQKKSKSNNVADENSDSADDASEDDENFSKSKKKIKGKNKKKKNNKKRKDQNQIDSNENSDEFTANENDSPKQKMKKKKKKKKGNKSKKIKVKEEKNIEEDRSWMDEQALNLNTGNIFGNNELYAINDTVIDGNKIRNSSMKIEKNLELKNSPRINIPNSKQNVFPKLTSPDQAKNLNSNLKIIAKLDANTAGNNLDQKFSQPNVNPESYHLIKTPDSKAKANIQVSKFRDELAKYRKIYLTNLNELQNA